MKSELQKAFYNPAQTQTGMNPEVDCMEKWFWEAQSEGGTTLSGRFSNQNATLYVSDIPRERSKVFVKHFLRDNIPNSANICVPVDRVSGTIEGSAFVELSNGVNVKDVLKQVKGLKMGSRQLKIKELSGSGGGNSSYNGSRGGNSGGIRDAYYRPSSPTPIRMQSPVMFEK